MVSECGSCLKRVTSGTFDWATFNEPFPYDGLVEFGLEMMTKHSLWAVGVMLADTPIKNLACK